MARKKVKFTKGDCFRYAYEMALNEGLVRRKNVVVVHADVRPIIFFVDKKSGKRTEVPFWYAHAWAEMGGKVYDWQTMVSKIAATQYKGKEWPKKKPWPKEKFYEQYDPTNIQRYSAEEAIKMAVIAKHFGPWTDAERSRLKAKFGAIWSKNG